MDFYFVKTSIKSKATAENMLGYFFGKISKEPEYDFIVVPARYGNMLNLSLESEYKVFMDNFRVLKKKILEEVPESMEMTDEFMNYLNVQLKKKGPDIFGAEISAAIKNNDADLVHYIISELIRGWTPRSDVAVGINALTMEEISMENFLSQVEDLDDENLLEVLLRPDIKDLPEIFPIIDPVYGKSITEFDIGDSIFFVVLNPGSDEFARDLEKLFPNHFRGGANTRPFVGTIISKELVVGKKGGRYFLIKVDFGKGITGKGIVSKSLKIMGDLERFEEKLSKSVNEDELFEKVSSVVKNAMEKELPQFSKKKTKTVVTKYVEHTGMDFLVAFLMTILVVGMILIVSYFLL